jgi:chromosome segregation ATPase
MSAAPEPVESAAGGGPEISAAAQIARERLQQEIERVRVGVEEMLDEQEARGHVVGGAQDRASAGDDLRRELEGLRLETRNYVKKKVRKSEKKLRRSVREIDARTDALERRIDQVEAEREAAEWRIHNSTEQMLDGLLADIRSIADRLTERPAPTPAAAPAPEPAPGPAQAPVGRVGPRPRGRRTR